MLEKLNLCEIVDSYYYLRYLEEKTDYYGNVDMLMSLYPKNIRDLCIYIFDNYSAKGDVNVSKL